MMQQYITAFPEQLKDAITLTQSLSIPVPQNIQNIVISGMGGSGISGTFAQEYAYSKSHIPIFVNKSYQLPSFVNAYSLVILSSYSGNTEETLNCLNDAIQRKAIVIGITSGGKLEELSEKYYFPIIKLPQGYPPRTCLAYSLVSVLHILNQSGILSDEWKTEINESVELLTHHQKAIQSLAKNIAQQIHKTFPVIYSLHSEALAWRLRQQLNENSKMLCSHHIIPEMNHNEIVGWKKLFAPHSVISILTSFDLEQNKKRYEFCKKIFQSLNIPVIELHAIGKSILAQWMYMVHLSDWLSYELALLNEADPIEVQVIDELKNELSK